MRLRIYPDGGVARLRVHGAVVPSPALLEGLTFDLAALSNGGDVVSCSDLFYSAPRNVISPGLNVATPAARVINSQRGGRIDDTVTRFCCSISASRSAYSNAVSAWRCTPTPRVRNTHLGNGNIVRPLSC